MTQAAVPAPSVRLPSFACPHCGAHPTQYWYKLRADRYDDKNPLPLIPTELELQSMEFELTEEMRDTERYKRLEAIEIDNNAAERALRGPVLSRKNFLFVGAGSGGERAAAIYSLLETAKLQGRNPEAYLRHVLERIADHPINRIEEVLPCNVVNQIQESDR